MSRSGTARSYVSGRHEKAGKPEVGMRQPDEKCGRTGRVRLHRCDPPTSEGLPLGGADGSAQVRAAERYPGGAGPSRRQPITSVSSGCADGPGRGRVVAWVTHSQRWSSVGS